MKVSGISTQGNPPHGTANDNGQAAAGADAFSAALQSATASQPANTVSGSAHDGGATGGGADAGTGTGTGTGNDAASPAGANAPQPAAGMRASRNQAAGSGTQDDTTAEGDKGATKDLDAQAVRAELIAALLGTSAAAPAAATAGSQAAGAGKDLPGAAAVKQVAATAGGTAVATTAAFALPLQGGAGGSTAPQGGADPAAGAGTGQVEGGAVQADLLQTLAQAARQGTDSLPADRHDQATHAGTGTLMTGTSPLNALLHAGAGMAAATQAQTPGTAPASAAQTPAQHQATLAQTAGSPGWGEALGSEVAWMAGKDLGSARLRLHPETLGSMDVRIQVQHGRVDVAFVVQHPAAAAAVQDALAQLGSQLGQHGLSLGDASVAQQQHQGGGASRSTPAADGDTEELAPLSAAVPGTVTARRGLLDAFA